LTETLTESFCERCGTRYEFSAPTRLNPLRKTRGLIGGLKNYLTSQDALGDAMDDAMRTEEGALATAQLDAFHEASTAGSTPASAAGTMTPADAAAASRSPAWTTSPSAWRPRAPPRSPESPRAI
jgi:hypothetical protein